MQLALKRSRDHSDDHEVPEAKIAKQVQSLRIYSCDAEDDMSGVEARDFTHVTVEDMLEAAAEIEIDDRFLKIPRQISQPKKNSGATSTALIPYEKPSSSERPDQGAAEQVFN